MGVCVIELLTFISPCSGNGDFEHQSKGVATVILKTMHSIEILLLHLKQTDPCLSPSYQAWKVLVVPTSSTLINAHNSKLKEKI